MGFSTTAEIVLTNIAFYQTSAGAGTINAGCLTSSKATVDNAQAVCIPNVKTVWLRLEAPAFGPGGLQLPYRLPQPATPLDCPTAAATANAFQGFTPGAIGEPFCTTPAGLVVPSYLRGYSVPGLGGLSTVLDGTSVSTVTYDAVLGTPVTIASACLIGVSQVLSSASGQPVPGFYQLSFGHLPVAGALDQRTVRSYCFRAYANNVTQYSSVSTSSTVLNGSCSDTGSLPFTLHWVYNAGGPGAGLPLAPTPSPAPLSSSSSPSGSPSPSATSSGTATHTPASGTATGSASASAASHGATVTPAASTSPSATASASHSATVTPAAATTASGTPAPAAASQSAAAASVSAAPASGTPTGATPSTAPAAASASALRATPSALPSQPLPFPSMPPGLSLPDPCPVLSGKCLACTALSASPFSCRYCGASGVCARGTDAGPSAPGFVCAAGWSGRTATCSALARGSVTFQYTGGALPAAMAPCPQACLRGGFTVSYDGPGSGWPVALLPLRGNPAPGCSCARLAGAVVASVSGERGFSIFEAPGSPAFSVSLNTAGAAGPAARLQADATTAASPDPGAGAGYAVTGCAAGAPNVLCQGTVTFAASAAAPTLAPAVDACAATCLRGGFTGATVAGALFLTPRTAMPPGVVNASGTGPCACPPVTLPVSPASVLSGRVASSASTLQFGAGGPSYNVTANQLTANADTLTLQVQTAAGAIAGSLGLRVTACGGAGPFFCAQGSPSSSLVPRDAWPLIWPTALPAPPADPSALRPVVAASVAALNLSAGVGDCLRACLLGGVAVNGSSAGKVTLSPLAAAPLAGCVCPALVGAVSGAGLLTGTVAVPRPSLAPLRRAQATATPAAGSGAASLGFSAEASAAGDAFTLTLTDPSAGGAAIGSAIFAAPGCTAPASGAAAGASDFCGVAYTSAVDGSAFAPAAGGSGGATPTMAPAAANATAGIVGGIVAGLVVLGLLGVAAWVVIARRNKRKTRGTVIGKASRRVTGMAVEMSESADGWNGNVITPSPLQQLPAGHAASYRGGAFAPTVVQ